MSTGDALTIKKGILAVVAMYACQLLAGLFVSIVINSDKQLSIEVLGLLSALIGGALVLSLFYWDQRKNPFTKLSFTGRAGTSITFKQSISLILLLLTLTHVAAYIYRSIILPEFGHAGVVGGGSQVFSYIHDNTNWLGMLAFLTLALCIGPIMEEVVFREYLQRSLSTRFPVWIAISITSAVFMFGHSPMILWPMYFVFSAAWGYVYMKTGRLSMAILFHVLNNLFYTVIGFLGLEILA